MYSPRPIPDPMFYYHDHGQGRSRLGTSILCHFRLDSNRRLEVVLACMGGASRVDHGAWEEKQPRQNGALRDAWFS